MHTSTTAQLAGGSHRPAVGELAQRRKVAGEELVHRNAAAWRREHDTPEQAGRLLDLALTGMLTTAPPAAS
ncbi:hypothetical protein ACIHEI_29235 [Kitasatospora sp. NPDC051984]|uniref:hypothetical protein n=1 Tax=unclassified Kitasatospora TaxID=2633591 RepID=UPI003721E96E